MAIRRWSVGAIIILLTAGASTVASYVVLNHFYGTRTIVASIQTIVIENSGQRIVIGDVPYHVGSAELVAWDNESYYRLFIEGLGYEEAHSPADPHVPQALRPGFYVGVPVEAYERAQTTGEPVTIPTVVIVETRPIDVLPIAASIGIAMGVMALAVWIGYRQMWGDATSTLLEHGLHDMTVRDIEIVGYIMGRGEFTIPELMKLTKASKITIWRTVRKLVERGLVRPTDRTRPAANGLGGRGKPSQVYEYVGAKGKP